MAASPTPEDFYRRYHCAYPWAPGYRFLPPWLILPAYLALITALWVPMAFATKGQWVTAGIISGTIFAFVTTYAFAARLASARAGVPIGFAEWRQHLRDVENRVRSETTDSAEWPEQ